MFCLGNRIPRRSRWKRGARPLARHTTKKSGDFLRPNNGALKKTEEGRPFGTGGGGAWNFTFFVETPDDIPRCSMRCSKWSANNNARARRCTIFATASRLFCSWQPNESFIFPKRNRKLVVQTFHKIASGNHYSKTMSFPHT
jgi:hypothetical protein